MINKFALAALGAVALFAAVPAEAKDLRGDNFISTLNGNTLVGKQADGTPYRIYFVPGGGATMQQGAHEPLFGKWELDKAGDVCLKWPSGGGVENGCYRVSFNGSKVTWSNKDGTHKGGLLGGVAPLEMSKAN
jgi:hypothetical protein